MVDGDGAVRAANGAAWQIAQQVGTMIWADTAANTFGPRGELITSKHLEAPRQVLDDAGHPLGANTLGNIVVQLPLPPGSPTCATPPRAWLL